jgi:hypothetical protein
MTFLRIAIPLYLQSRGGSHGNATQHQAIDTAEREFVSAQLDQLALTNEGLPWSAWKEAVLEWHLEALAAARSEAWIPGLADGVNAIVERALERLYGHHVAAAIKRLRVENIRLRRRMLEIDARRTANERTRPLDRRWRPAGGLAAAIGEPAI